jgi:hypothetical protein
VIRSLSLRQEPSVRQANAILTRIETALAKTGADVTHDSMTGIRFKTPPPWRAPQLGILLVTTSGYVKVSAGAGGPWQVRYELSFATLNGIVLILTGVIGAIGWSWSRLTLLGALLALWLLGYGVPHALASRRFHRLIASGAHDVVERRTTPRSTKAN